MTPMTPLRLTDEQLNQVMRTAAPIPPELRDDYLQHVADQLRGPDFGDGEVYRACRAAAKAAMWNMQRAIDERQQVFDRLHAEAGRRLRALRVIHGSSDRP